MALISKSITTTDATVTPIYESATISINSIFRIEGVIVGRTGFTAAYTCSFEALFRRGPSGSLVLIGSAINNPLEDSAATPAVTITVSSNAARVNVTGVVAETWIWKLNMEIIRI